MPAPNEATRIVEAVADRSAHGLAAAVNRLIRSGELPPGTRLPTVRVLARELGVSPTTVGEAWRLLARVGAIETRGRNGSYVNGSTPPSEPARFWRLAGVAGHFARDLSAGIPDPALLPQLGPALARVDGQPPLSGYLDNPVVPALEALVRQAWADGGVGEPEALTIVDGSLDGIDRLLTSLVHFGDRVVVENPTFPPFLDLLEVLGATPVPVAADDQGVLPAALTSALAEGTAAAVVLQPRAQNPTGASMTRRRARQLAQVVQRAPGVTVVEDDHSGAVAAADPISLAAHVPNQTVLVQSFSKSHGPDLRLAALGGPAAIVEPLVARRHLGASWSSRFLQQVLVGMLTDPTCTAAVDRARVIYAERRAALRQALAERGVTSSGRDGINVWVDVDHERDALIVLAAQGIGVAPGSAFVVGPSGGDHIRVTTSTLPVDEADTVADAIAHAAHPRPRPHARSHR
ncbi:MAG TPA: aminotransferase class I/II-fold pyridoxal phosphate-dependent enzyme [Acidimicrobiales bacterium]|nr:aminotransferase class I/II-fold pyridoxal phosphate-dependent enzyme [Acidimicrobiales bacterium]